MLNVCSMGSSRGRRDADSLTAPLANQYVVETRIKKSVIAVATLMVAANAR
jgi:hypothetical protein